MRRGNLDALQEWLRERRPASEFTLTGEINSPLPTGISGLRCENVTFSPGAIATDASAVRFEHCTFAAGAIAKGANLTRAVFLGCTFHGVQGGVLQVAMIDGGSFHDIDFSSAALNNATVRGVTFERTVALPQTDRLAGLKLDRAAWDRLKGVMTSDQQAVVVIEDDGELLRNAYTGGWFRLHIIALLVFLLPHLAFFAKTEALSRPCRDNATLIVSADPAVEPPARPSEATEDAASCAAMIRGWRDGLRRCGVSLRGIEPCNTMLGLYWEHLLGHDARPLVRYGRLVTGALLLLYNLLRAALVMKALSIERMPRFSFYEQPAWGWLFRSYKLLFLFNVAVVIVHLATFLLDPIHVAAIGR